MDVLVGSGTGKKDEIADKVLPSQDFSIFCTLITVTYAKDRTYRMDYDCHGNRGNLRVVGTL